MSSKTCRRAASCAAVLLLLAVVLAAAYFYDNKYAVPSPRGEAGEFAFTQADLERPLVLTDGWLMELDGATGPADVARETFAGQYSNFSYVPGSDAPDGRAVYTLTLRAVDADAPVVLSLYLPEVFGDYVLYVDGKRAAWRGSGAFVGLVVDGAAELTLDVRSAGGYYSGLVYPPVAGSVPVMEGWQAVRTAASGAACLVPLVLAALACAVWAPRRVDSPLALFAGLCLVLAGASFGPFAWQLGWSGPWQHAVEDALWTAVLSCSAAMVVRAAGLASARWYRIGVRPALLAAPLAVLATVGLGIPAFPVLIGINETFQVAFRLAVWALVVACAVAGVRSRRPEVPYILCGAAVMALAFVANLLDAGSYEPLYGLWQSEYAGLVLMAVFAALIASRGRRLVDQEAVARETAVQLRAAEQTAAHVRRSEEETRMLRHDLKHHANALAALLDEGAWDRARAYARDLGEGWADAAPVRYSGNPIVNAALAAYLAPAAEEGIEVACSVRVPDELPVSDGDLAVLLANALSNAVEGCRRVRDGRRPRIRFDASWEDGVLCLRCENTAPVEGTEGRTSKRDVAEHGFGLSSMRQIAKRYDGAVCVEHANGAFVARCLLRPRA
ncbi:sensor histidine kinase [Gordonibacter massiliensis (ex Traore et al. 2017)]|uniref:sensor histidine kinase n=1 Tax=Gordonibacter massiliensis (ex Traore et al. 2017) TaxID=1841863 RepID=UPI001C8BC9F2|nr:GHKL domain-containing protein [Gordonibacter massiliensis (ex Traore et al. 2017)]MBX9033226.1 GHKL domain-containing protein [Gordonibacter massiliensis (ex Traore et al. 2017)]